MSAGARRAWIIVGAVVSGIATGAWALARYGQPPAKPDVGGLAPAYRLVNLANDDSVEIRSAYAGHVTLINVWATWCGPCRAEMPSMQRMYQQYRDKGFRIAAVSVDEGDDAMVMQFARSLQLTFDILHDRSGDIQQVYQMIGVPQSFLLDRRGRVVWKSVGKEDWDTAENRNRVAQLLGDG